MLVKFDSEAGSFIMDGSNAVQLLKAMGHSGTVPGAILPADIPGALERLKSIVEKSGHKGNAHEANSAINKSAGGESKAETETDAQVSLRQRAFPLIELLTRAAARDKEVVWR
jgi:hypothetical protein